MRFIVLAAAFLAVAACQSTNNYQSPNWQSYDRNELKIQLVDSAKGKTPADDPALLSRLASLYANDPYQAERQKAKPILQALADAGDIEAKYMLAMGLSLGNFGEVSDSVYELYKADFTKSKPEVISNTEIEKKQWVTLLSQEFDALQAIYQKAVTLCEQPLLDMPASLATDSPYNLPQYASLCLRQYSFGKNAAARLAVLAEFDALYCKAAGNNGLCLAEGFNRLATADIGADATDEQLYVIAHAIRDIYNFNKRHFRVFTENQSSIMVSDAVAGKFMKAIAQHEAGDVAAAIKILEDVLSKPNLSLYDRAFIEKSIGNMSASIDPLQAISYLEQSISRNVLSPEEMHQMVELRNNLYLLNRNYKQYLVNTTRLLMQLQQKEPAIYLLPVETQHQILHAFATQS